MTSEQREKAEHRFQELVEKEALGGATEEESRKLDRYRNLLRVNRPQLEKLYQELKFELAKETMRVLKTMAIHGSAYVDTEKLNKIKRRQIVAQITFGFTGTRKGMTEEQEHEFANILGCHPLDDLILRHGDCLGADADAHHVFREHGQGTIIIHPPSNPQNRAFCDGDEILEQKPYLERNHDIVDNSNVIIACPGERQEILRSGTWSTIRYARSLNMELVIIYPGGDTE